MMIIQAQGEEILKRVGVECNPDVTPIKEYNHIYRLESRSQTNL